MKGMEYVSPHTRVTDLALDTDFLASGKDKLNNGTLESVEYEEF